MKISIGSDHAGFRYKELIKKHLERAGHEIQDFGTNAAEPSVDYPAFIRPAALAVSRGEADRAVVLGGSGNGEAIAANRIRGVRCTLCWNVESARLARAHNDSNCLSIGERLVAEADLIPILEVWLNTPFEGGRHQRRIEMLEEPLG
jgi:ribose 5-phosphate isomerase B